MAIMSLGIWLISYKRFAGPNTSLPNCPESFNMHFRRAWPLFWGSARLDIVAFDLNVWRRLRLG